MRRYSLVVLLSYLFVSAALYAQDPKKDDPVVPKPVEVTLTLRTEKPPQKGRQAVVKATTNGASVQFSVYGEADYYFDEATKTAIVTPIKGLVLLTASAANEKGVQSKHAILELLTENVPVDPSKPVTPDKPVAPDEAFKSLVTDLQTAMSKDAALSKGGSTEVLALSSAYQTIANKCDPNTKSPDTWVKQGNVLADLKELANGMVPAGKIPEVRQVVGKYLNSRKVANVDNPFDAIMKKACFDDFGLIARALAKAAE